MKKTTRQRGNIVIGLIIGLVLGLGVALGIAVYVTKVPIPFVTKTQRGGAEQDEAEARKNRDWDPNAPLAGKAGAAKPAPAATGPVNPVTGEPATTAVAPATAGPTTAPPVPVVVPPTAVKPRTAPVPAEANALPPSNDPLGDLARARSGGGSGSTTTASAAPSSNSGAASSNSGADPFMYFVQAGAFRTTDDAEAQRAKLSLMGVEAKVTEREQAGRTVYRVRAGPFNKKEDADRLKERLDGGGLDSALVRVQR
ncbi:MULTISPECIES: SPOR domain-containing protein [Variovorax]|jgi:cell division protein FtsN|uniref:SPOR domain-containing protein n=1 Tax=Variovorax TaxID=34072 RepID=UPI00086B82AE|nr:MULTISPECIES: SPOR domain-containing protein [Variovorax]MBN8755399.1 SPOR domain-containing protein [Variovorax sp.]ODU14157.1 MAG: sporulation protein [Variovorax sp. SCN 67-85]ODV22859.1 MAG: sporulation protein [Variovorax sp. SCN 67-20]OJZ12517.1 MAG: sporulation protein [Variovorax sp. 67-131]UKI09253.1 SPOR domain-containing protein [Variovorax paradoxus]